MSQNCEDTLLALPTESKLLLAVLMNDTERKVFARSIAAYQVPGDVLICSSYETTSGSAAEITVTT